jgi:ATP-binding protein involved in chromosome partitioning
MAIDRQKILEALSTINDPGGGRDLVSNGMIDGLEVDGNKVNFNLVLPNLAVPYKSDLNFYCIGIIQKLYPEADVNIHVTTKAQVPESSGPLPQVKNIIAVASGKGGVGKSTVATNLAFALKGAGASVGLLDADLYGPSIPTMVGLKGQRPKVETVGGKHKIVPLENYDLPVMSIGFVIEAEQAVVLRGPRLSGIIKQFVEDCIWPDLDYLVVDLPPGTGDIQLTLVQTVPVTGAVIVTTPQEVAIADALKAANMFRIENIDVPLIGVVENMSWFTPEELPDHKYFLFGKGGGQKL